MKWFVPLLGAFAMTLSSGPLTTISVTGAVQKPGEIEVTKPTRLRTVIKEHGGLRPDADPKKIEIRSSDGTVRKIDFTRFDQNDTVKAGDQVLVPIINEKDYVFVNGGVQARGPIDYKQGLDIVSVVNDAGLPNPAVKSQVKLIRDGKTTMVNINKIESGVQANIALMPADRIEVPHAQQSPSNRDLLIGIGIVVLLIFLFR